MKKILLVMVMMVAFVGTVFAEEVNCSLASKSDMGAKIGVTDVYASNVCAY